MTARRLRAPSLATGLLALAPALAGCGAIAGILAGSDEMETAWTPTGRDPVMTTEVAVPIFETDVPALAAFQPVEVGAVTIRGDASPIGLRNRVQRLAATSGATHCLFRSEDVAWTMMVSTCWRVDPDLWSLMPPRLRPSALP